MNFTKLTDYLDNMEAAFGTPGLDCIILRDHEVIYRHRAGFRDYGRTAPVDGTELYDIYSASKVAAMTALLQLEAKGLVRLDDPVSRYLPCFADMRVAENYEYIPNVSPMPSPDAPTRPARKPILLWHLMSMTSGMSYDLDSPIVREAVKATGGHGTTLELMEAIAKLPLLFEPGERYCYSLSHDVIAAVVEVVSGVRYQEYLRQNIFSPLGVEITMHPGDVEKPRMMAQWKREDDGRITPESGNRYRLTDRYDSGGAGIVVSAGGYAAFMDALACGGVGANGARILSEESIRKLSAPRLGKAQLADFNRTRFGYSYGLGVRTLVDPTLSKTPVGEFGWDGAAGLFGLADPENRISLVYGQQVLYMGDIYDIGHPTIRDLTYTCLTEE